MALIKTLLIIIIK